MGNQPDCCHPSNNASAAERAYCAYQAGGSPERAGLNYQGLPCPTWAHLTREDASPAEREVVAKWKAVAAMLGDSGGPLN